MNLSRHFTLEEMVISDTARKYHIANIPNSEVKKNLAYLCHNCLEPLRELLDKPIIITSGYRCDELNKRVKGSQSSQHRYGQAVDIMVQGMSPRVLYLFIKMSGLEYDQLILEQTKSATWVHISYTKHNRHQNLIYNKGVYTLD